MAWFTLSKSKSDEYIIARRIGVSGFTLFAYNTVISETYQSEFSAYVIEGESSIIVFDVGVNPTFGVAAIPGINVLPMGEQTIEGITMTVSSVLNTEAPENMNIDLGEEASMVFL